MPSPLNPSANRITEIQAALRHERIDGWLFYDFRHSDPIAYRVLGIEPGGIATRRWFYFVPAEGDPVRLVHQIERSKLASLPGRSVEYAGWEALMAGLRKAIGKAKTVAMQYSPMNAIPYLSRVDAGTVEAVRACGVEVVSSANLVQRFEAVWSPRQWTDHQKAAKALRTIVDTSFQAVAAGIRSGNLLTECSMQALVLEQMAAHGLVTDHPPIVAVNAHSADPHFVPARASDVAIGTGDFLLLDLWAKPARPGAVYADYTWTAYAGETVPRRYAEIFEVVRRGRDAAVQFLEEALADKREVHGWEVDAMCRREIEGAGYGEYFIHRTGHSIGEEDHGNGANIDNFETHDDRLLIPQTCFSIEPGIYLPGEFGVRSEINVYIDENLRPQVTGTPIQTEVIALLR